MPQASSTMLVAATLIIGAAVTACGDDNSPTPSSSATSSATGAATSSPSASPSAAAQPSDYTNLLIKPTDIVVPGDTFILTQAIPLPTPAGVEGVFTNQTGARKIDDTIYVHPGAGSAGQAFDVMSQTISDPNLGIKGPVSSADIGSRATVVVGQSPDGAKSVAMVIFTEGRVFTVLELDSPPNDPVSQDFILELARKQDAAIKSGLPA